MSTEAKRYLVKGIELKCTHCGNDTFTTRRSLLSTAGKTFLNFDWMNPDAQNFICDNCGLIMWFMDRYE